MSNIQITSLVASVHDTSFGGYPYKVTAIIEIPIKEFNKKCPITGLSRTGLTGRTPAKRDLGHLVLEVNNTLYKLNSAIPAYNPSIDSNGSKRASKGVKTLRFEYFFKDLDKAVSLGFEHYNNSEHAVKYGQYIDLLAKVIKK